MKLISKEKCDTIKEAFEKELGILLTNLYYHNSFMMVDVSKINAKLKEKLDAFFEKQNVDYLIYFVENRNGDDFWKISFHEKE